MTLITSLWRRSFSRFRTFGFSQQHDSPYMLIGAPVADEKRAVPSDQQRQILEEADDLRERVNVPRSEVPAITHVDYSARLQTVDNIRNPRLHRLLSGILDETGCPVLVNTSFNVRGEPIVCTPEDAYRCCMATEMDVLVLENCVVLKTDNEPKPRCFRPGLEQRRFRGQIMRDLPARTLSTSCP